MEVFSNKMVVIRRKKVVKYRGSRSHGGGSGKKRRGAGSRGGKGMAGTGKRAGHKKAGLKLPEQRIGAERGFRRRSRLVQIRAVNVGFFTKAVVSHLLKEGKARQENGVVAIDLKALGYDKLLGTGTVSGKFKFIVASCSAQAAEKVQAAGGEVLTAEAPQKSAAKVPAKAAE